MLPDIPGKNDLTIQVVTNQNILEAEGEKSNESSLDLSTGTGAENKGYEMDILDSMK